MGRNVVAEKLRKRELWVKIIDYQCIALLNEGFFQDNLLKDFVSFEV